MPRIETLADVTPQSLAEFDDVIDVRSPAEFTEDHIPGAINLPVLSDAERAEVGTVYVQDSRFRARRLGASLVTNNISQHLAGQLAQKPAGYRPLIYCWRGGMRSNAMATILSAVGWRVGVVAGGYQTWRRSTVAGLRETPTLFNIVLLDGQTGSAKTEILKLLAQRGVQTLDLEAAAHHRGSVFGNLTGQPQPCQKLFESQILYELLGFDADKPIVVEAESSLIGKCCLPNRLLKSMRAAPRIEISAEPAARARYLVETYKDLVASSDRLQQAIEALRPFHSREQIEQWLQLASQGEFETLAASLTERHYDPLYTRQRKRRHDAPIETIALSELSQPHLECAAQTIDSLLGNSQCVRQAAPIPPPSVAHPNAGPR